MTDDDAWFDVAVSEEYYGEGYERGDIEFLIRLADWLERQIPGAEIWYGHDSADASFAVFGPAERGALMSYYNKVGHEPYLNKIRQPGGA